MHSPPWGLERPVPPWKSLGLPPPHTHLFATPPPPALLLQCQQPALSRSSTGCWFRYCDDSVCMLPGQAEAQIPEAWWPTNPQGPAASPGR